MKYVNEKYLDATSLKKKYKDNEPFPHIVLDNFVDKELLNNVLDEFPDLSTIEEKRSFNEPKQIKFGSIGFKNLSEAANQLIELFQPLATVTMVEEATVEPEPSAEAQIPLEELNLSVRAYNCLKRAQVNSVSDLMGFSYEDLLEIKNFGSKSADEVIEALERIGISIPQSRTSA